MGTLAFILGIITGILTWLFIWPIIKYVCINWLSSESERAKFEYQWENETSRLGQGFISVILVPGICIIANIYLWCILLEK